MLGRKVMSHGICVYNKEPIDRHHPSTFIKQRETKKGSQLSHWHPCDLSRFESSTC